MSLNSPGPDEPPHQSEMDSYWSLRQRRRWVLGIGLTFLPIVGGAYLMHHRLGAIVAVSLGAALVAALVSHSLSRCPRCGERCFTDGSLNNAFATRCLHYDTQLYWSDSQLGVAHDDPPESTGR